jgi:hypothetical protein
MYLDGPGTLRLEVEDRHDAGANHYDIGFVPNRDRTDVPVLWDCVTGIGPDWKAACEFAAQSYVRTTVPVFREFLSQDGSHAGHFGPNDADGCPGWHVIHGPLIAYTGPVSHGADKALQDWVVRHPLLPALGPMIAAAFERPLLNIVRVLLSNGEVVVAEVRVNGEEHRAASDRLARMDWPRSSDFAILRCNLLFVHGGSPAGIGDRKPTGGSAIRGWWRRLLRRWGPRGARPCLPERDS